MLNYSYDNKSDIPAGAEKFYSEKDGKFTLQVDGVKTEADVQAVKDALDKERKAKRDAEAKAKSLEDKFGLLPEDFNIDEYNRLKDSDPGKELETKLAEQRERIEGQFKKQLEAKDKIILEKDGLVHKHVKIATLQKAMAEVNVGKQFMPAVEAMMKDRITVEGDKVYLDERPVAEALKEWAGSDEGKHYVSAPANSGGGSDKANQHGKPAGKTITRSDFDALSQADRMAKSKEGVKVVD